MKVRRGAAAQARRKNDWRRFGFEWGRRLRRNDLLPIDTPMVTPQPPITADRSVQVQFCMNAFYDGVWTGYMGETT